MPETVAAFFTAVGETITGFISGAINVFTGIWEAGPVGQVMCTLGIGSAIIGFGLSLFKIRGGRRKSK